MSDALLEKAEEMRGLSRIRRLWNDAFRILAPPAVRLAGAGVQFLSTVLIARQLGDEGSAVFFFWSAILTSFAPVATYGLEQIALRSAPRLDTQKTLPKLQKYLANLRFLSLALSILIGIVLVGYAVLRSGSFTFAYWHLLLPIALGAMSIAIINGESLKGLSRPIAGIAFGHTLPVSLFCILIACNLPQLTSPFLIGIYTLAYVLGVVLLRLGPIRVFRYRSFLPPRVEERREILREGFPIFCTNSLGALSYVIPLMLLDLLRPAEEVSYVTTSFRISILFAILAVAVHGVFAPRLSRAAAIPANGRKITKVYLHITSITLLTLFLPYAIGIAFPEWVMSVFGEKFIAGAPTLRLLLISGLIAICLGPVMQLLLMIGKTQWMARLGLLKLTLAAALSAILIPQYGGVGMVIAMAIAFAIEELAGLTLAWRHLRKENANP